MKRVLVPIALVLLVVLVAGGFIYHRYTIGKRNVIEDLIAQKTMINILVTGGNRFNNNHNRFYAIVSINPENGKAGLTFIPPEFRIGKDEMIQNVDFSNDRKIRDAISSELGIKIPFYIVVYAPDIVRAVDLTNGFDIFQFEKNEDDSPLLSGGGIRYLDGKKVMRYVNGTDFSVYQKYDRILDIVFTAYYKSREKYDQLLTPELIALLRKTVKTNMLSREMFSAAKLLMQEGDIITTLLPGRFVGGLYQMDDISKEVYNSRFLKRLVIGESGEKNVKVRLLNGTNVPGLARKIRDQLMREGVVVVEFGTAASQDFKKTIIINQKGSVADSRFIGEIIGITNVHYLIDSSQLHAITVIIGEDLSEDAAALAATVAAEATAVADETGTDKDDTSGDNQTDGSDDTE